MTGLFDSPRALTLSHAPEGVDAWFLAGSVGSSPGRCLLHIARDDARMARLGTACPMTGLGRTATSYLSGSIA